MRWTVGTPWLGALLAGVGCSHATAVLAPPPDGSACDTAQAAIAREADTRAMPWSAAQHLAANFPNNRVSWLMTDSAFQTYIVKANAKNFGRCNDSGCFLFAAPTGRILSAIEQSMTNGKHDPAVLGRALGLPAKKFEGPLRLMTLDLGTTRTCARLPVDSDPGAWKCTRSEDSDCFKFGGYTSGGLPEVMVINAQVSHTEVREVP
ncbi:hypothetical protein DRW03_27520 [Corallococcus sp. H22C18031201]|nr:hypothetical protein DRW03_27520 [Corallococcus sp. H22C18031201]